MSIASCEARLPRSYPYSGAASGLHKLAMWLVSPSPPCLSCARSSSSSCREKQQVCRLRGFRPRKLVAALLPLCHLSISSAQVLRAVATSLRYVGHDTSYLEGSSMFRAAALAQGRNMTSRTPRTLCHLVAIVRPRQRVVAPTKGLAGETLQPSGAISRQPRAAPRRSTHRPSNALTGKRQQFLSECDKCQ